MSLESVGRVNYKYTWLVRPSPKEPNAIYPTRAQDFDKATNMGEIVQDGKKFVRLESFTKPDIKRWKAYGWEVFDLHQVQIVKEKKAS